MNNSGNIFIDTIVEAFSHGNKYIYKTDKEDISISRVKNNEALQLLERL